MYKKITVAKTNSAVHVHGVFSDGSRLPRHLSEANKAAGGVLADAFNTTGFDGNVGQMVTCTGNEHMLVGLGKKEGCDAARLRKVGAKLGRHADNVGLDSLCLHLCDVLGKGHPDGEASGRAVMEGICLSTWRVDGYRGKASKAKAPHARLRVHAGCADCRRGLKLGLTLSEATNAAREVAATPPNICNPTFMVRRARALAKASKNIRCRVIDYRKAQELGMGGLVNVGKGSNHKPAMIILEYRPPGTAKKKPLALVGKTITFDTGGYSLKISGSMRGMKSDKNGGMAVLGAMKAIDDLGVKSPVVGVLAAAENMVDAEAYRVDDIITMYNGVTVEVTNTDAEGRLVLADALAYTCKHLKPAAIVDVATLTGGVVVALGHFCAGMWCNDEELRARLNAAGDSSDERYWHMPLWKEHCDFMRAKHADLWNSAPSRNAHPIQGAAFLSYFVDDDVPWAHLDIAGMSDVDSDTDLAVTGPTGFGVRSLTDLARSFSKKV